MIRDLEAEVVAIRNLLEVVAQALPENEKVSKALQQYQKHRCARFDQEVEEANKVLEKNVKCYGYEYHEAYEFVPGKWLYDERKGTRKLFKLLGKLGVHEDDVQHILREPDENE